VRDPQRIAIAVGALVLAVVLFLVFRPGDDDGEPVTLSPPPAAETEPEPPPVETDPVEEAPAPPPAPPPPPPGPREIVVTVADGRPVGGIQRIRAERNEEIELVVRADVSDHVHVHGYDLIADVAPGSPARIAFRTRLVGVFEIELEDRRLYIAELEVRP
jgi:hypothetical protein